MFVTVLPARLGRSSLGGADGAASNGQPSVEAPAQQVGAAASDDDASKASPQGAHAADREDQRVSNPNPPEPDYYDELVDDPTIPKADLIVGEPEERPSEPAEFDLEFAKSDPEVQAVIASTRR
jgi:hypothetical protein